MRPAARSHGAILLTVLITGLALLLLALAGATLAMLHLHAAHHAERAQRARIVARSGLELVDVLLADRLAVQGTLPPVAPTLPEGHGLDLTITGYHRRAAREAEVEVEGRSDGAVATAGARLVYP